MGGRSRPTTSKTRPAPNRAPRIAAPRAESLERASLRPMMVAKTVRATMPRTSELFRLSNEAALGLRSATRINRKGTQPSRGRNRSSSLARRDGMSVHRLLDGDDAACAGEHAQFWTADAFVFEDGLERGALDDAVAVHTEIGQQPG